MKGNFMKKSTRSYLITTHPDLALEFISCACTENCKIHTPNNTSKGSHRYFIWGCKSKHTYKARVNSRASGNRTTNCAKCSSASIPNSKDKLKNSHPELFTLLKNCLDHKDCDKESLTEGSNCNYLLSCTKGHSYTTTIYNATRTKLGCHLCISTTLAETDFGSELIRCLCSKCKTKPIHDKNNLTPKSGKPALWSCKNCSNQWQSRVADRTSSENIDHCPICYPKSTSNREKSIMSELAKLLSHDYQGPSIASGWKYPVDYIDPDHKIVIQYDSFYWHKDKILSDNNCNEVLSSSGWKVIRIREKPLAPSSALNIFITKKDSSTDIASKVYQLINNVSV